MTAAHAHKTDYREHKAQHYGGREFFTYYVDGRYGYAIRGSDSRSGAIYPSRAEAAKWARMSIDYFGDRQRHTRPAASTRGDRLINPQNPRVTPKASREEGLKRLRKYLISRGASKPEAEKEVRKLESRTWASRRRMHRTRGH